MYYYIFDAYSQRHGFQKALDKIGLQITDLELDGEKVKETIAKNISLLTKEALEKEVKNLIIVGEDKSFNAVIKSILASKKDVALGYIPLRRSLYSELFEIPLKERALETISKRKVVTLDIGKINHHYFLSSARYKHGRRQKGAGIKSYFQAKNPEKMIFDLQYNDNFDLHAEVSEFSILNVVSMQQRELLKSEDNIVVGKHAYNDGRFDVHVLNKEEMPESRTCFQATHLYAKAQTGAVTCMLDECVEIHAQEFTAHTLQKAVHMIVGNATLFK